MVILTLKKLSADVTFKLLESLIKFVTISATISGHLYYFSQNFYDVLLLAGSPHCGEVNEHAKSLVLPLSNVMLK